MLIALLTLIALYCTTAFSLIHHPHHPRHAQHAFSHAESHHLPFDPLDTSIGEIQRLLETGGLTSVGLVEMYLDAIEADNFAGMNLRAVFSTAPRGKVLAVAAKLDEERSAGFLRSDLHGIPILLKDNIATGPELGMPTTAGSLALVDAVTRGNSDIVDRLIRAGAIILGKAAMSEFASWKASGENGGHDGWSAVGGQTSSAYVEGGFEAGAIPLGSSAGSAVSVSAGFAPIALGSDTTGSCLQPASRAALYAIRPTHGLVNISDVVPIRRVLWAGLDKGTAHSSVQHDTVGPMAFTAYDAALVLQTIAMPHEHWSDLTQYTSEPHDDLSRYRIGVPDALFLQGHPTPMGDMTECELETTDLAKEAFACLAARGADVVMGANMNLTFDEIAEIDELWPKKLSWDGRAALEAYFRNLVGSPVRTLAELVNFNDIHADEEMPPGNCCQERLVDALAADPGDIVGYQETKSRLEELAGAKGLDFIFDTYGVDAIMLPAEMGRMGMYFGIMGYPAASAPLGYCRSGLPFGMMIVTRPYDEPKLVGLMSAWEKVMRHRLPPEPLIKRRGSRG